MSKGLEAFRKLVTKYGENCNNPNPIEGCYDYVLTIKKELKRVEELEKENQELAETLELYNEKFAGHERVKANLTKENQELKRKYESHDFLYQNEISKNGALTGKIFEKDLKIQKLTKAIEILKNDPHILEIGLENFKYDDTSDNYYYEVDVYDNYLDFKNPIYIISKENYELLEEALKSEKDN